MRTNKFLLATLIVGCWTVGAAGSRNAPAQAPGSNYAELVEIFNEFRDLERPTITNGVPNFGGDALRLQYQALGQLRHTFDALRVDAWPVSQKVDYLLVRGEMNGLDFYHRVLRPWSRDPGFYLQTMGGSGPSRKGVRIRELPIPPSDLSTVLQELNAVPVLLSAARENLRNVPADLVTLALHYLHEEVEFFKRIRDTAGGRHPELVAPAETARVAVVAYGEWLDNNRKHMNSQAGIGKDNYNWWLRNVQLVPYTWDDFREIVTREDERVLTYLELERNRNRHLPELEPVATADEHARRQRAALEFAMQFLSESEIATIPDYLDASGYLSRGPLQPPAVWPRPETDFFDQTGDREPLPEQVHEFIGHYFDNQQQRRDERAIRGADRLFAIDMIRLEGWAFGLEELLMHSGYLDQRSPRGREIVYMQTAFRSCRAIADQNMHANEFTLQEAINYCYECAPNGWLLPDGYHVWYEMATNLRFPGWHSGMVIGKSQFIKLFGDRVRQLGPDFVLRDFIDEFLATGSIPFSLIRWEMTGLEDEIQKLW